jgi:hypothetical protein
VVTPQLLQLLVEGLGKAERLPSKLAPRIRFPSPAPRPRSTGCTAHEQVTDHPVLRGSVALAALPVVVVAVELILVGPGDRDAVANVLPRSATWVTGHGDGLESV